MYTPIEKIRTMIAADFAVLRGHSSIADQTPAPGSLANAIYAKRRANQPRAQTAEAGRPVDPQQMPVPHKMPVKSFTVMAARIYANRRIAMDAHSTQPATVDRRYGKLPEPESFNAKATRVYARRKAARATWPETAEE